MKKRNFLKLLATTAVIPTLYPSALLKGNIFHSEKRLNILVLGGRGFLGPTIIKELLDAGHRVTILNRGITNPHLFKELPFIKCDRELEDKMGILSVKQRIEGERWDSVIDTWQKSPKAVQDFLEEFGPSIGHYHYISTFSVYDKWNDIGIDEQAELNEIEDLPVTIAEEHRYAIRKTMPEHHIMEHKNLNWTIYRCHGIRSDRLPIVDNPHEEPYWPIRFHKGGEILLPDVKDHHIQMTDAVSLSRFIIHTAENGITGKYNVAYPSMTFKSYISSLIEITGKPKKQHWIPGDFLIKNEVVPYREIEYWKVRSPGSYYFSVDKALKAGLKNRPVSEMLRDQITGYIRRYPEEDFEFGGMYDGAVVKLSSEKERDVIHKWLEASRK